jgi:ribosomal protein S18 acetylase RimI-like enzyme
MKNATLSKEILVKKCLESDYGFVHNLSKESMEFLVKKYWKKWDSGKFKEKFNKDNISIVQSEGTSIGFFDIEIQGDFLYLHNIQLDKNFQGKGVGTYLMFLIEEKIKSNDLKGMRFEVFKNTPAANFYLNLGYEIIKDNGNSITMEKVM